MNKILLIDVSSVFHRAYSSLSKRMPEAIDINGIPCAGTYGFLTSIFRACREFGPFTHYLFAIDVKGSTSTRKKENPNYKSNRKPKDNSFYKDRDNLINNILPKLDILPLGLFNYEADDIIASACKYIYSNPDNNMSRVFIMSGDKDLEQCVKYSDRIDFIKTQPKWELLSNKSIMEKWANISPNDIPLLMSIIGDGSDNIKGIRGYKLKRALTVYLDDKFLNDNKDIIEKNLSLIKLKDNLQAVPRKIKIKKEIMNQVFLELNSKSLIKRLDKIYLSL